MNFFSRAASALAGLSLFASLSAPALAAPTVAEYNDHVVLSRAVKATGTRVYTNTPHCDKFGGNGMYSGMGPMIIICQDNRTAATPYGEEVEWTANDLGTLRHEAHHLMQDCKDGKIDQNLDLMAENIVELALDIIGPRMMDRIDAIYTINGKGADVELEWEAFSVEALNLPLKQAKGIARSCPIKGKG